MKPPAPGNGAEAIVVWGRSEARRENWSGRTWQASLIFASPGPIPE